MGYQYLIYNGRNVHFAFFCFVLKWLNFILDGKSKKQRPRKREKNKHGTTYKRNTGTPKKPLQTT